MTKGPGDTTGTVGWANLLASLPPPWSEDLFPHIKRALERRGERVVALDDDPMGAQTVHNVVVMTHWDEGTLTQEVHRPHYAIYLLTNSRGLAPAEARRVFEETGRLLRTVEERTGVPVVAVSRSDSTLRGHFPLEMEALERGLGRRHDGWLLVPCFFEGGRYTAHDVQYVRQGDRLTPASETEYARDPAFAYRSSDLRRWVQEKTDGVVRAEEVVSISLEDVRLGGPGLVADKLTSLRGGAVAVANAVKYRDLEVLVAGLLEAEAAGKRILYRTAASFLRVRAGIPPEPLLDPDRLVSPGAPPGLIVVGSYVPRTTRQLEALLELPDLVAVELRVRAVLDHRDRQRETARVARAADEALGRGLETVVFTSRERVTGRDGEESLAINRRVSRALVEVVQDIRSRPGYVVAKGGVTAFDVATDALGVRRALVLGQVLPGIPAWRLGHESRYPGLACVVFPGNIGEASTLRDLVASLQAARRR